MKTFSASAVASCQATQHPILLIKLEANINASATAGLFLQIHDSNLTPVEGAVPTKWWPASDAGYKEFKQGELSLIAGCYVCLSTTGPTKTLAAGGSDLMDALELEFFMMEQPTGTSFAGSLTSSSFLSGLTVWADGAGPKRLICLEVNGASLALTQWLMVFGYDILSANNQFPLLSIPILAGTSRTRALGNALTFGNDGIAFPPTFITSGIPLDYSNNGVKHNGCYVAISSRVDYFVQASSLKCRAEYK